jgi:hypothetical protein
MAIPQVIKDFLGSERAVVLGLLVAGATYLAATGKLPVDAWLKYTELLGSVYIGGKSLQSAAEALSTKKTPPTA